MTDKQTRAIEYLKNLHNHLYKMDYKEICIDLDSLISDLPISTFTTEKIKRFEETQPRDLSIIYRARENETFIPERCSGKLPLKTLDEISIISEENKGLVKTFGRCNKPKEPRFYSSNNMPTACIEAITSGFTKDVAESKYVTVGSWKIIEPLNLAHINYSEKSLAQFLEHDKERYDKMIKHTRNLDEHNLNQIKEGRPDEVEYQYELYKFFADEFAKVEITEDYDYKTLNYYCDHAFDRITFDDKKTNLDGILYPSVSFSYQEMNLVLHPRAMRKIKFLSALNVWVVYHGAGGSFEFIPLEQNVKADSEGNLQWNKFKW